MKIKNTLPFLFLAINPLTGCGPAGPALGLGPELDQLVGLLFLGALVVIGFLIFRTMSRSRK